MSERKDELKLEIEKRGYGVESGEKHKGDVLKRTKSIVERIRDSREIEKSVFNPEIARPESLGNFRIFEREVLQIDELNKKIEDQIKMEVLGIQDDLIGRVKFRAVEFYNFKIKRKKYEPVESLINKQLEKIREVSENLGRCVNSISLKLNRLEAYYDRQFLDLLLKYKNRERVLEDIKDSSKLMSQSKEIAEKSENFEDKLYYAYASRRMRKDLSKKISRLKSDNRVMIVIQNELPMLDNLSGICEAYCDSLSETYHEAEHMKIHLENVVSLYMDMLRSNKADFETRKSVKGLFRYTQNMSSALKKGSKDMVKKAEEGSLFENEFRNQESNLDVVLNGLENSRYNKFLELEDRISKYSKNYKEV